MPSEGSRIPFGKTESFEGKALGLISDQLRLLYLQSMMGNDIDSKDINNEFARLARLIDAKRLELGLDDEWT